MRHARLDGADLSADMRNQSMGLMRGVLRSVILDGASLENANLSRAVLEFASLRGASLKGARLNGSELGGASFHDADVSNADFENADVTSTRLIGLRGRETARNLDRVRNSDRAIREEHTGNMRTRKEMPNVAVNNVRRVRQCDDDPQLAGRLGLGGRKRNQGR